jgi:hypothetical protein
LLRQWLGWRYSGNDSWLALETVLKMFFGNDSGQKGFGLFLGLTSPLGALAIFFCFLYEK